MSSLDLGLIGNCSISVLIDRWARVVWWCLPRFDGDPVFHQLLGSRSGDPADGAFSIEVEGQVRTEQSYITNTAILSTRIYTEDGSSVEILDHAPRFEGRGRMFRPMQFVRQIKPIDGRPRIRIRIRPVFGWARQAPEITSGSNHIRYVGDGMTLRMTTNAPVTYIRNETWFQLDRELALFLGPDETLTDHPVKIAHTFVENTEAYWRGWSRRLGLPREWQEAVIRAAITLKMCTFEETGAIVAAITTSIPEAPNSGRTWDYRYCWLRDAFFVVRALNGLSDLETMENYLRYIQNIIALTEGGHVQPVYGIGLESALVEGTVDLPGYRGMGPVRTGNQAYEHFQHDVYGNIVLGAAQAFFDRRLLRPSGVEDFRLLEKIGERAYELFDKPDAGMWELRTRARVHTSSSLMCWAALDRLAKIANELGLDPKKWRARADEVRDTILERSWNEELGAFAESFEGSDLDAGLLLAAEVGLVSPTDPRFVSTVDKIGEALRHGDHLYRYAIADDFGRPETAFNICTFWYIDALARIGRVEEAREIYESMLACRNHLGLLSEDVDPATGELWGNFPQTYSMVGIINGAMRLSRRWDKMV
ncbi:glycoside hydrolase family 15 protein [Amorphus orientalis]|uniref:Pentatricopeptide repeat protein n=1 Tax=Amorphus orientalis TaxID=649198 RepID=A0AAE4AT03_9HYPH|nr:glycoside hydrolase family 15 protein [Amorphus orientalis]MDQ0316796.1 pentatricopeptide repeat protein [Amorphus orientalis]